MDFIKNALGRTIFRKKNNISIMAFLPRSMPPSRKPILEVRIVKKPHGRSWIDVHCLAETEFRPVKDEDDEIDSEDMEVTCQLSGNDTLKEIQSKKVFASDLDLSTKETIYFELDLTDKADDSVVELNVKQSYFQKVIRFGTRFQADATPTMPKSRQRPDSRVGRSASVAQDDAPHLSDAAKGRRRGRPRGSSKVMGVGDGSWSSDRQPGSRVVNGNDEGKFQPGQSDIDPKEAIMNGTAPWNRSRIMVIGPAGVGKTSLIRRLTGQEFNPHETSTKGAEQNVVTKNAVNSWELVNDAHTAKDDLIQSIAMDSDIRSHSPRSTGGEENRSDPEINFIFRMLYTLYITIYMTLVNFRYFKDSNRSTLDENEKIANILQGITREEITKVKSSKVDITYSIWDFGGQEVYYITHPLFLSWRSLYILVIPLHLELSEEAPRKEDAENTPKPLKGSVVKTHRTILDLVHFWLMSVYTHAVPYAHLDSTYEPKVLIIGTFAGDKSMRISQEKVESKVQELKVLIGSQPYQKQVLFPICVIDNKSSKRSEVNEIRDRIDGLIKDLEYMKVQKPVKWRTVLTEIEGSAQNTLTVSKVSRADIIRS